jgi:allose kinase
VVDGVAELINTQLRHYQVCCRGLVMGFPALVGKDKRTIISTPNLPLQANALLDLAGKLEAAWAVRWSFPATLTCNSRMTWRNTTYSSNRFWRLISGREWALPSGLMAPWTGAHGVAGELGHIPQGDMSRQCGCGNAGCLETVCSGIALKRGMSNSRASMPLAISLPPLAMNPLFRQLLDHAARHRHQRQPVRPGCGDPRRWRDGYGRFSTRGADKQH